MFYDKFLELCNKKGIKPTPAAVEAGISKSLVTKWRTEKIETPSPEVLAKVAQYFGITIAELLGEDVQKNISPGELIPTERESRILEALRSKTPAEQKALLTLLGIED